MFNVFSFTVFYQQYQIRKVSRALIFVGVLEFEVIRLAEKVKTSIRALIEAPDSG